LLQEIITGRGASSKARDPPFEETHEGARVFGSYKNLGKFDEKADHGIFIGYSLNSHAYMIYNKRLMSVEESVHVVFDEVDRKSIQVSKNNAEEDEQNINLEKLDYCAKKQPVE